MTRVLWVLVLTCVACGSSDSTVVDGTLDGRNLTARDSVFYLDATDPNAQVLLLTIYSVPNICEKADAASANQTNLLGLHTQFGTDNWKEARLVVNFAGPALPGTYDIGYNAGSALSVFDGTVYSGASYGDVILTEVSETNARGTFHAEEFIVHGDIVMSGSLSGRFSAERCDAARNYFPSYADTTANRRRRSGRT